MLQKVRSRRAIELELARQQLLKCTTRVVLLRDLHQLSVVGGVETGNNVLLQTGIFHM